MEENLMQEQNNENVENVLNSVSDAYLAKKKRNRIISFSIISAIIFALAISIIVMSCIKVDLRPQFMGRVSSYRVTIAGSNAMTLVEDTQEYDEFNKIYLDSFQTQYLSALLTGRLGGYTIQDTQYDFYAKNSQTAPSSELLKRLGDNYVRVSFAEDKQVLKSNGKIFKSSFNSDKSFSFNEMYFNLNTENNQTETMLYLGGKLEGTDAVRIIEINVRANTYDLYKFATK